MSKALLKSTSLVSAMTLLSRILGFVRDMVAAQIFGATASVDAFYIAFRIPNFMRNLFAEGSFSQAVVPLLAEYRHQQSLAQTRTFISHLLAAFSCVLLALTALGVFGAKGWIYIFAPGLDPIRFSLATEMLQITFPYLMLIALTAFAGAILNTYGRFGVAAFTPALLNICLIAAAFWLGPQLEVPVVGQAWGVLIAGFVQLLLQLPFLARLQLLPWPRWNWRDPGVRRVLKLMLPALLGASVGQISLLLNTVFASFLTVGSVTWLYYSDRLAYFPLGVVGVALATVTLPQLARSHSLNSPAEFTATLHWGIRCNLVIGLPASVAMCCFAYPLIITLFQYGKFSAHDVAMTYQSVLAYAVGLQAFMLAKILSSAYYAQQDIKTPVRISLFTLTANMILNACLVYPLAHAGLALASSLAAWLNVALLLILLHRRAVYRFGRSFGLFALRLLLANAAIAALLRWASGDVTTWLNWPASQRFLHLFLWGGLAIILYIVVLALVGLRWQDFKIKPAT